MANHNPEQLAGHSREGKTYIPTSALAKALSVSKTRLYHWKAAGCPCIPASALGLGSTEDHWNPESVRAWLDERGWAGGEKGNQGYFKDPRIDVDLKEQALKQKIRKETALAEKHEHFLQVARGEVISREAYRRESLAKIAMVKAKLLALPGELSPRLANRPVREVHFELERKVQELLKEFAQRKLDPELTEVTT